MGLEARVERLESHFDALDSQRFPLNIRLKTYK